jgi:hypothetical protein
MSLPVFTRLLADQGAPKLTRQRLSGFERGQRLPVPLLYAIAEACATIGGLPDEIRGRWLQILRQPDSWDRVPGSYPSGRRKQLRALTARATGNPRWPLYRELAGGLGVDLDANLAEARRCLELPDNPAWQPVPDDRAVVVSQAGSLRVTVERGELFIFVCTLSNCGSTAWRDRLLIRLGPPVTSSLAYTPPVLSLPDTHPGAECRVVLPGRGPWFPNLSVVTYIMTFPDCRPCLAGSLRLWVDARQHPGPTTQPLPPGLAAHLRSPNPTNTPPG